MAGDGGGEGAGGVEDGEIVGGELQGGRGKCVGVEVSVRVWLRGEVVR